MEVVTLSDPGSLCSGSPSRARAFVSMHFIRWYDRGNHTTTFMLLQCHIQPSDWLVGHIGFFTDTPVALVALSC